MARPMTWNEVLQHPSFQNLTSDQREAARNQYFRDVVAPQIPTEHLQQARAQFDADTAPTTSKIGGAVSSFVSGAGRVVDYVLGGLGDVPYRE